MADQALAGKRVLIREDLNVPVKDGKVTSTARLDAALPTLRAALDAGARVMVMSHLGRPKEGKPDPAASLAPVAAKLGELLGRKVPLAANWLDGVDVAARRARALRERALQRRRGSRRRQASRSAWRRSATCSSWTRSARRIARRRARTASRATRPIACAGPLLVAELEALGSALESPKRPLTAIIGGSKVSTKIEVLQSLSTKVDELILGGGIANTILAASGVNVGKSLHEKDMLEFAAKLLRGEFGKAKIPLPTDVVVAHEPRCRRAKGASRKSRDGRERRDDSRHRSRDRGFVRRAARRAPARSSGTARSACSRTRSSRPARAASRRRSPRARAFSIAGGGDTLAAIEQFGVGDRISYISTGGGAFLEFLEGKKLPAVATLEQRAAGGLTVPQVCRRALVARAGVRRRRRRPRRPPFACRRRSKVCRAGPRSCSAPARPPRRWRPRSMRTGARPVRGMVVTRYGHGLTPGEQCRRHRGRRGGASVARQREPRGRCAAARACGASSSAGETLCCLISGGGSSLASQPLPVLTFEQKRAAANFLIRQGADIREINCVRKHLSRLKGGRLARRRAPESRRDVRDLRRARRRRRRDRVGTDGARPDDAGRGAANPREVSAIRSCAELGTDFGRSAVGDAEARRSEVRERHACT